MSEILLRVTRRVSLPTLIEACSVSSTPRSAQNRNSAIITLSIVRIVRRLLRPRFTSTSESRLIVSSSGRAHDGIRAALGLEHALLEVQAPARALGGVRVVRHHHDRLLELAVEPLEQR